MTKEKRPTTSPDREKKPITGPDWERKLTTGPDEEAGVVIIAEAGVNHNGSIAMALSLIEKAKQVGADIIKFQAYFPGEMVVEENSQYQMLKRLSLGEKDFFRLQKKCAEERIPFLASVFDEKSLALMGKVNVPAIKIPSGEITNLPLIKRAAATGRPLIISTGMSTLGEVEAAVLVAEEAGNKKIALLHCVSEYPARLEKTNLRAIKTLRAAFKYPVGFSDHTEGYDAALLAVALGARIIEKHFTLDKNLPGPDHKLSLTPGEFQEYVRRIKSAEKALGNGRKIITAGEKAVRAVAGKSLVTRVDIKKGTVFSEEMLALKRPGTGIPPQYLTLVAKARAARFIPKDSLLQWSDFILEEREKNETESNSINGMQGRLWDL
jgi:sialic acid synthase SpsE